MKGRALFLLVLEWVTRVHWKWFACGQHEALDGYMTGFPTPVSRVEERKVAASSQWVVLPCMTCTSRQGDPQANGI